jgi:trehalose/maltose hydrolase-like predicted phosphorylase
VPAPDPLRARVDPRWCVVVDARRPGGPRAHESLLCLADGMLGTRGAAEEDGPSSSPLVVAAGIYTDGPDGVPVLLPGPEWATLLGIGDEAPPSPLDDAGPARPGRRARWVLDLRSGLLYREHPGLGLRSVRFACLARPGTVVLRLEAPSGRVRPGPALRPPSALPAPPPGPSPGATAVVARDAPPAGGDAAGDSREALVLEVASSLGGGIVAAASQRSAARDGSWYLERVASYAADPRRRPNPGRARAALREALALGVGALEAEQRAAWAAQWSAGCVSVEGDPELELAARFALFHLVSSATDRGEAAVGARGLSGPGYGGHVFWDADVFVLPCLAAVRPGAARAMLEYRRRRLPAARRAARRRGLEGARFPWESARDGDDVTPRSARAPDGSVVPILTGELEEHIVADVAWAAAHYAAWSGDDAFLHGAGAPLLLETARYWASRLEVDPDGTAHLRNVIGPDEYHVGVDDNMFTNVMARWNLRRAAALLDGGVETAERPPDPAALAARWRELADRVVDGYDPRTGRHEQFRGYDALEPLLVTGLARPPVAADLLLGPERVAASQIVKQADVLMAHHLVPRELPAGSLEADLDYYAPRTAHGSSLSPAIHASLLARAGRPEEALEMLRLASRIDLDDVGDTTAGGLHLAAMGGVWQALAFGFAGLEADGAVLRVDPSLPPQWRRLELRFLFRGTRVVLGLEHGGVEVETSAPLQVALGPRGPGRTASGRVRLGAPRDRHRREGHHGPAA